MSDGVAGAGANIADRQAHGHTAAPNGNSPAAPTGSKAVASGTPSTPNTQSASSEAGKASCGIAGMGSGPVAYLPDMPPAMPAIFSGANAAGANAQTQGAMCYSEPLREVDLSRCHTVEDFVAVLKAQTNAEQQRLVVDRALGRFTSLDEIDDLARQVQNDPVLRVIVAQQLLKYAAHPEMLQSAYMRGSRIAPRNIDLPERRKEFAAHCGAAIVAMFPQKELAGFLLSLSRDDGERFALALDGLSPKVPGPEMAHVHHPTARVIDRVLAALNEQPTTATTAAIVENLCRHIVPTDFIASRAFERAPLSPHNVANAIANLWYPNDPARAGDAMKRVEGLVASRRGARLMSEGSSAWRMKLVFEVVRDEPGITAQTFANYDGDPMRHPVVTLALARKLVGMINGASVPTPEQAADAEDAVRRISGILQTDAGRKLISGPAPEKAKLEAWAAIVADPKIKPETFTNDNPFSNPLLMDRIAPLYAAAGAPQELAGKSLRNLVGLAIGLTPTFPPNVQITIKDLAALQQALARGEELKNLPPAFKSLFIEHDLFGKNLSLDTIVSKLDARASTHPPRVAFEFNVLFTELGAIRCPAFRVQVGDFDPQTGGPKYEYADNTGRCYPGGDLESSLEDYLHHNKLPAGVLYYTPHNSLGARDKNGVERLAHRETPAANSRVENAIDAAALVGCLAAGIVGLVVSGGVLALAAGGVFAAGSGWDVYRGYQTLADRAAHGQSNNPFAAGAEGREAFMLEVGIGASALTLGAVSGGAAYRGLRAVGGIGNDAKWADTGLRVVNTGAAGANVATVTVTATDLAANANNMTRDELVHAGVMAFFHSVLAARAMVAPHGVARPAAGEPPPTPVLPPAVAKKGAANNNLAALNGGQTQNTPGANLVPGAVTNPASGHGVPAQNMPRGNLRNDNVSGLAQTNQQPVQQPVALAANGGAYVPTDLNPGQTSAAMTGRPPTGHPAPPPRRPTVSYPVGPSAPPQPPAPAEPQTRPNPRLGSEPGRPTATPPGSARPGRDVSLRGSLRTQRPDLWSQLPRHVQTSGDNQIASWLSANRPQEWETFVKWLRNHNYDAYSELPENLKLPEDRAMPSTHTTASAPRDIALEGYLISWLKEKEWWDAIPANLKQSERALAQWLNRERSDLWHKFAQWLSREHTDVYRRTQPESLIDDDDLTAVTSRPPQQNDPRGGRSLPIHDSTAFMESVIGLLPPDPVFRRMVLEALKRTVSENNTTIRIGDLLRAIHECADVRFDSQTVTGLDAGLHSMVPDYTPAQATPGTVSGELGSASARFRPDDLLPLSAATAALSPH